MKNHAPDLSKLVKTCPNLSEIVHMYLGTFHICLLSAKGMCSVSVSKVGKLNEQKPCTRKRGL